jgi:hypothetical protein
VRTHEGWRYSIATLDLGTSWRWVLSFASLPIYLRWDSNLYQLIWCNKGFVRIISSSKKCCHLQECKSSYPVMAHRYTDWVIPVLTLRPIINENLQVYGRVSLLGTVRSDSNMNQRRHVIFKVFTAVTMKFRLLKYKNPVPTSQETHYVSATESSQLILCKIWGFQGGDYEECHLMICDAVLLL